jgi:outer membrane protein assembly factor BamA
VVTIQRVRFKGLKKSNPAFVEKLSGLTEGEPFTDDRYRSAIKRIEAGGFLQNDSLPAITPNEDYDGVELLFYLTELKSNQLELGGGYLPAQGAEKGEFVGRMRFDSKNLFGFGRQINLFLNRKDRASSQVEFRFGQPLFIPDHIELAMHLSQVDYDSSYYAFTLDGSIGLYTAGNTRLSTGLSWTKTEPQRSSQPPSRTLAGLVTFEKQGFDYSPNPSTGRRLAFGLSYLRRTSWPDTVATAVVNNESKFEIGIDNYFRPIRRLVLRLNLETKVLITSRDLIDYSEQFKLGGYGSLRGYRQDQFAGRRIFLGQSEIRLRPARDLAFYIFTDVGYVYSHREVQPGMVAVEDITRVGSGLGLFVGSPAARMTLEIGWGEHDSLDQGKIHFGLVTLF